MVLFAHKFNVKMVRVIRGDRESKTALEKLQDLEHPFFPAEPFVEITRRDKKSDRVKMHGVEFLFEKQLHFFRRIIPDGNLTTIENGKLRLCRHPPHRFCGL